MSSFTYSLTLCSNHSTCFLRYYFYHLHLPILELIKKLEFLHTLKDVFEHKITSILFILDYFANHQE